MKHRIPEINRGQLRYGTNFSIIAISVTFNACPTDEAPDILIARAISASVPTIGPGVDGVDSVIEIEVVNLAACLQSQRCSECIGSNCSQRCPVHLGEVMVVEVQRSTYLESRGRSNPTTTEITLLKKAVVQTARMIIVGLGLFILIIVRKTQDYKMERSSFRTFSWHWSTYRVTRTVITRDLRDKFVKVGRYDSDTRRTGQCSLGS